MDSTLTFTISVDGTVRKDPDPFHAGPPKSPVTIVVVNDDGTAPHLLEMAKIKHLPSDKLKDPITGPKKWLVPPLVAVTTNHKVKDNAEAGRYGYVVILDNRELTDPEIVVDPPLEPGAPKRKAPKPPAPKKRAKAAQKGGKKRAAKKKSAKKKVATKKARRR